MTENTDLRQLLLRLLGETVSDELAALPEYATAAQVGRLLQMSEGALAQDRYRNQGIPYIKIGKRIRYRRSDVAAFIATSRRGSK